MMAESPDAELTAIAEAIRAIQPLSPEARIRVLIYLGHRFGVDRGTVNPNESAEKRDSTPLPFESSHDLRKSRSKSRSTPSDVVQRSAADKQAPQYSRFLSESGLPENRMGELFDLGTGEIHASMPWKTASEKVRRVAALIAVYHLALEGALLVPQNELASAARAYSAYDPDSTSTYLKRARWQKSPVFFRERGAKGWKMTLPGRGYAAETIRVSLGLARPAGSGET